MLGLDPFIGLLWADVPNGSALPDVLGRDRNLARRTRAVLAARPMRRRSRPLPQRRAAVVAAASALRDQRGLDGVAVAAITKAANQQYR
jgi:hypothetical protein